MLHLHFSNRYEALAGLLLERLADGGGSAFAADTLIVPSAAVRRQLTLAIAHEHGVCANVQFDFLARWLWRQIGRVLPGVAADSPFAPSALVWRVWAALGDAGFVAGHPRLARYLAGADALMRFELAGRVAALLEQYVTYRPDWLQAWQHGRPADFAGGDAARADAAWQAALWRRIAAELGLDAPHPSAAFVGALQRGGVALARSAGLPARAHVFALPTLPPLHVELLEQLGRWVDIDVYVLDPCREYWFELIDRRRLAHLAARGRAAGHEEGNRLLAAWGRQTQAHIDLLVDRCGDAVDDSRFAPNDSASLLAAVQNAILDLIEPAPGSLAAHAADRSIEVHACHSLGRQLEVLHDRLLGLFAADPGLRPSDVLVVTPDLEAAAALIDAVFGSVPAERRVPYAITGRARSRASAPARALLDLLALAASRVPASAVFGLLQQPIVARRFGLDDDESLERVHGWLRDAGYHWGLDATQRAAAGVPALERHTLADALARLHLGYALPAGATEPFAGLLPAGDAEGSAALALGDLWRYAQALARLHDAVQAPRPPAAWADLLHDTCDRFLAPADDELEDLRELHEAIAALADAMRHGGLAAALPLPVLRAALAERLDEPARGGVPTGSVTFASMGSLRGLPFAVVCAIGLDDGVFPGTRQPTEFDLMAVAPRRGDRQRRDDERNLFLDLLLAARRHLHLSYTGRSVRDNAPLPPSVLVAELLDVLVPAVAEDPSSAASLGQARRRLVVEHPLQPFAIEAFAADGDPRLRSHDRELAEALRRSLACTAPESLADAAPADPDEAEDRDLEPLPPFFTGPLAAPGAEWRAVSVEQLVEFFRNPCRYLLKRRLGIELQGEADELEDDEPFLADWPVRMALARRLLPALLDARIDLDGARRLALAGTELPGGALGQAQLESELGSLDRFAARVRAALAAPALPPHGAVLDVDLDGEAWRLSGAFADLRAHGLVRWRYDERRAGDVLAAWIPHLLLAADPPADVAVRTRWLSIDGTLAFGAPEAPRPLLSALLRLYRRGLAEPLRFFPKAAWAYLEHDQSLQHADQVWTPRREKPRAEGADPAYRLALRGAGDALQGEFADLARAVFAPALAHLEGTP
ncbi:MAG TPA: exodeoxyribonuclease V subunit gamma [Burkholderiaceae bacterium]